MAKISKPAGNREGLGAADRFKAAFKWTCNRNLEAGLVSNPKKFWRLIDGNEEKYGWILMIFSYRKKVEFLGKIAPCTSKIREYTN